MVIKTAPKTDDEVTAELDRIERRIRRNKRLRTERHIVTPENKAVINATMQSGPLLSAKPAKVSVTIRLDADIVDRFKATGKGWQTRMNEALRNAKA